MDSARTSRAASALKRYQLVSRRAEPYGARIKRFRLMQMEALSHLEPPSRAQRVASR